MLVRKHQETRRQTGLGPFSFQSLLPLSSVGSKGWFSLEHKHKHKQKHKQVLRGIALMPMLLSQF